MDIKRSYDVRVVRAENNALIINAFATAYITMMVDIDYSGNKTNPYLTNHNVATQNLSFAFEADEDLSEPLKEVYARLDKDLDQALANLQLKSTVQKESAPVKRGRGRPRKNV